MAALLAGSVTASALPPPPDPPDPEPIPANSYVYRPYKHHDIYGSGRWVGNTFYLDYLAPGNPNVRRVGIDMFNQIDFSNLDFRKERVVGQEHLYRLRSWATGKCLDSDAAGGAANGRPVLLATCDHSSSQRWRDGDPWVENDWEYRQFISTQTGLAMDMSGANGVLAAPNFYDNDQWFGAASHY